MPNSPEGLPYPRNISLEHQPTIDRSDGNEFSRFSSNLIKGGLIFTVAGYVLYINS